MHIFNYTIQRDCKPTVLTTLTQALLVILTLLGTSLISLGLPEYGIIIQGVAQIFWLYNSYIIYRDNNIQWGMFFLSIIMALIIGYGIINYWYLN